MRAVIQTVAFFLELPPIGEYCVCQGVMERL
jgi:hypothetical protein